MVEIGADTSGLDRSLSNVDSKINKSTSKWGKRMKMAGVAMVAAVTGIGIASLKMAADFDTAMREVNTMMLLNDKEFGEFSKEVQSLARAMGVDATEAANALYQAISAGVPKENAIDFLRIATKAAIGGVTDTTTAVDGLTTVINAFNLPMSDAQKVADIMFTTVKGGKTTMEELSASMFNVAPMAASAGIEFEVVAAALATMTKQGVPTAQATTQLRQAIVSLMKPTTDMARVIEELGYESGQAMLEELGFAEAIEQLRGATEGSDEMLMKMFGSVEAGSAVLALTGASAEMFAADLASMADAAGAAEDAFDEMEKTAARKLEKLKTSFKDIAITIGTILMPILTGLLDVIKPLIDKIASWVEKHPLLTKVILATVLAIGVLLIIIGPLMKIFYAMKKALIVVTAAQWLWNIAITANPIGLIIIAIAAFIGIVILLVKKWDWVKEKLLWIWRKLKDVAIAIWNALKNFFGNITGKIKWYFLNMTPVGLMIKHWDTIKNAAMKVFNFLKGFFQGIWGAIKAIFTGDTDAIKDIVKNAFNVIDKFLGGKLTKIRDFFADIWTNIKDFLVGKFTAIKNFLFNIWDSIIGFFKGLPEKIGNAFRTIKDIILSPFRAAMRGIEAAINWLIRQMNKISFKIPNWVPFIGGKHFGINIPEISLPTFAKGGLIPEPTLLYGLKSMKPYAIAGERGPERVVPGEQGGLTIQVNQMVVREEADIGKVARELFFLWQRKTRAVGA